jgi:hypothetical protein
LRGNQNSVIDSKRRRLKCLRPVRAPGHAKAVFMTTEENAGAIDPLTAPGSAKVWKGVFVGLVVSVVRDRWKRLWVGVNTP